MRLLVVEDNKELAQLLTQRLPAAGYETELLTTAAEAQAAVTTTRYAAMILSTLVYPMATASPSCARYDSARTRYLFWCSPPAEACRIASAACAAVRMTISSSRLRSKSCWRALEALLRRPGQLLGRSLQIANLAFDTESRQAFIDDQPQMLSAREMAVLELLMRRKDRVVSKKLVEDHIFGLSGEVASNAVEVYIHRLRKQLFERGAKVQIHTIRGVGYLISEEKAA